MQKSIAVIVAVFLLLLAAASIACANAVGGANAYTLQAENGQLLPPSGLSLEANGTFVNGLTPNLEADLSYGAFPAVTVSGQFIQNEGNTQTLVKALFSPAHDSFGYTAYLGYDLGKAQIPMYGLTLWSNLNYVYTFVNVEARTATNGESASLWLTPGATVKLGSKLGLSGEVEAKADNFTLNSMRLGASYALNRHLQTKLTVETGLNGASEHSINLGIVASL